MLTKSKIQIIKEGLATADDYRNGLENLMNKYLIEDSVFVYKNGMVFEATSGYFVEKSTHDNILDAIRECKYNFDNNGIRIVENKKFIVGELKKTIIECSEEDSVFDINSLSTIR